MERNLKELIKDMTIEEKASFCSGADFWNLKGLSRLGIPSIMVTDGPHGLRKQVASGDHLGLNESVPATCFPSAVGLASTWNRELIEEVGNALGKEAQAEDVAVLLGPGANIKRSPLCGRNFEYFSEDPYLSSELAVSHIKGVQKQGVGTSLKHFAANNQEHRRMSTDVVVDERTLREIYLASFESTVKEAKPWTVMCAYNKVNGQFASENEKLLNDILRDEWGFEGFVVSDWGAVNERVDALKSGLELEMPSTKGIGEKKIIEAIKKGELPENVLDKAVERLLKIIFKAVDLKNNNAVYDKKSHHRLARKAAAESIVMLKNESHILPLDKSSSIAVIGAFAKSPRFQGGGSSHINPTQLDVALDEIKNIAEHDAAIQYAAGYQIDKDEVDDSLIDEAKALAAQSQTAILFVGLPDRYESEGYDREHLEIPENHKRLIEAVATVQSNIVVVLNNGSPVVMPWLPKAKGVIEAYLGGQAGSGAVADILFGEENPSGKLAETFPVKLSDNPSYLSFPGEGDKVVYQEGIFVGYRYYDTKEIEPLFPFGFGMSYTTFDYSDLSINQQSVLDTDEITVKLTVKNIGHRSGKEIVQLYVRDVKSDVVRPYKELKGFKKVHLQPGERKQISFKLNKRAFAYYNTALNDWHVESGGYEILIGKSSKEIVLKELLNVKSTQTVPHAVHRNTLVGDLLSNLTISDKAKEWIASANKNSPFANQENDVHSDMMEAMLKYMPLRGLVNLSMGSFTEQDLSKMIHDLNETITNS